MKTLRNVVIAAFLIIGTVFLTNSQPVYASTCAVKETILTTPQFYRVSDSVFVGTISSIDNYTEHQWKIKFNAEKVWKGGGFPTITLIATSLQACGYSLVNGEKYLVFANGSPAYILPQFTKPYADAQYAISFYDDPKFQAEEKTKENLIKKLDTAKDAISNMMGSKITFGIPFNMVGVDELNATLDVGIDSTKATLSKEEYLKKVKDLVGDIPIKLEITEITTTGGGSTKNVQEKDSLSELSLPPLKQLCQGTKPEDIVCKSNFVLIINHKTANVACVRPSTLDRLASMGWVELRIDPKLLHMNIHVYGSYVPLTLQGHFLRGSLNSQTGPFSNVTVSLFANGVPMGTARTFPDGCFQFNNWDEKKFSPKIDEYVKQDRMQIEHIPKYILFSARYFGDKDHYPASAQASSYLYLSLPPIAPTMYMTKPQSIIENLTQANTVQFQIAIEPILKRSEIENPNLVLQPIPCGLDYDIKPIGDERITQNNDAKFIIKLRASNYVTPGQYFVKISNNPYPTSTSEQGFDDIGGFVLNIMEK